MTEEKPHYDFDICLRFWHPTRFFDDLEAVLGIVPTRNLHAGEPRATPKGTPLTGINKTSYWYASFPASPLGAENLPAALHSILDRLAPHLPFFQTLAEEGCRMEFYVGWFLNRTNTGDIFESRLLRRLAEFNLDLSLDIYAPTEDEEEEMLPTIPSSGQPETQKQSIG